MLYVEPTLTDLTDPVHIAIPTEKAFLVRSLLNYDVPHYFVQFSIDGVSHGLEILDKYEHLVVNRRLLNFLELDAKTRMEAFTQFDVKNSRGMQLYLALEEIVKPGSLKYTRDARLFEVSFYDFHCRKVFTVTRTCNCRYCFAQYLCLYCTYGFQGCGNAADVHLAEDGTLLGSIRQKLSFSSTLFDIYDKDGRLIMAVDGVVTDGILDVTVPGEDDPVAMIETLMDDTETLNYYKVSVPRLSSSSGITFFKNNITPEEKSLLLSTVILLDYMSLEPNSDYPHLAQYIPDDFQSLPYPQESLHVDGSKEVLVLTERQKKRQSLSGRRRRTRGKWGCCIWCGKLMCLCCFLAMKRNTIRCILLIFGIPLAIAIIFALIYLVGIIVKSEDIRKHTQ